MEKEQKYYSNVCFVGNDSVRVSVIHHSHKYDTKTYLLELQNYLKEVNNLKDVVVTSILTVENE